MTRISTGLSAGLDRFSAALLDRLPGAVGVTALALSLAACTVVGPRRPPPAPIQTAPAPLAPAPAAPVQTTELAPLEDAAVLPTTTAPATVTSVASSAVSSDGLIGGWVVSSGSGPCGLQLSRTQWTGGQRASTRGCSDPDLSKVQAWAFEGDRVVLKDGSGTEVARLSAATATSMSGATVSGSGVGATR